MLPITCSSILIEPDLLQYGASVDVRFENQQMTKRFWNSKRKGDNFF